MADALIGVTIGDVDLAAIRRQVGDAVGDVVKAVVVPALNRTAEQGATEVRRAIAPHIGLPQTRLKKLVKPLKANYQSPRAGIKILNFNVPLSATGAKAAPQSGSYPLKKTGPPVALPNKGFRATMRSGHAGFYVRRAKRRLPVAQIYAPSPRQVFETAPGLAQAALAAIDAILRKNLQSQIARRLAGR